MLPRPPKTGASIESFLSWENDTIAALGGSTAHDSVWACWQAAEGLCITAKEKRFPNYAEAASNFQQQELEIAVRRSGGTTVPHGDGILVVTHIAKSHRPKNIGHAYMEFCSNIQNVLKNLGFDSHVGPAEGAYCDGDYNVLLNGLKLAGTSQRWTRSGQAKTEIVLNHAVMLISCDSTKATQRVNAFHQLAESRTPFDEAASTSLWDMKQTQISEGKTEAISKQAFFNDVSNAFKSYTPN